MLRLKRIFLSTKTDNNLSVGKEPKVVVTPSISIFISRHGCFEAIGRYIKLTSQMVFSQPLPTIYEAWWNDLGEMLQNLQCFGIIWVFIQKRYQKNFKSSLLFQCLSVVESWLKVCKLFLEGAYGGPPIDDNSQSPLEIRLDQLACQFYLPSYRLEIAV